MSQVGDIYKITIVQELAGVQMQNDFYGSIDSQGAGEDDQKFIGDFVAAWQTATLAIRSNKHRITCGVFENQSRTEGRNIVFADLPGSRAADSHPQFQVVRFNEYARAQPGQTPRRGALNLSGVGEDLSTEGRINIVQDFNDARIFLFGQNFLDTPNGYTIRPRLRWQNNPGGSPPIFEYWDMVQAIVKPALVTLRRRKTFLCGSG